MDVIILKIFLLVPLITVWLPDLLGFGDSKEGTFEPERVKTRSSKLIYASWIPVFILYAFLVILYCFNPESVNWFAKISPLDNDGIKIFAILIMCFGYPLMPIGIFYMRKKVRAAMARGEKTPLVTTGIYHYTRNPMYLAYDICVLGTFLIMPNLLALAMAISWLAVMHAVSLDEEKRLLKIYGEEYEKYRNEVGMVFPKLTRGY